MFAIIICRSLIRYYSSLLLLLSFSIICTYTRRKIKNLTPAPSDSDLSISFSLFCHLIVVIHDLNSVFYLRNTFNFCADEQAMISDDICAYACVYVLIFILLNSRDERLCRIIKRAYPQVNIWHHVQRTRLVIVHVCP